MVIINPPFTRATGHEGKKIGIRNPMFAAFQADDKTQKMMGNVLKHLTANTKRTRQCRRGFGLSCSCAP